MPAPFIRSDLRQNPPFSGTDARTVVIAYLRGIEHGILSGSFQLAAKLEVDVDLALEFLAHLNNQ
jgi:hypothetical protein